MSLTYMRAQLVAAIQFWFVLVGAVVLLYLIGDVTENLDAWTGARGSVLLRLADVGLGLAELLVRVAGLLVAFALVFAWSRSATQGELTSIEAAGYSPWVHWFAVAPLVLASIAATVWFYVDGQRQLSMGRVALESLRQGSIRIRAEQRLWQQGSGSWLIVNARHEVLGRVVVAGNGHSLASVERWQPARADKLDVESATIVPADVRPVLREDSLARELRPDSEVRTGAARSAEQAAFAALMLIVAYGVVVRHGRGGGLAAQVIAGVVSVTVLWILSQVVDYVLEEESLRWIATSVVVVSVLTILSLFRRIRSL